MRSGGSERSRRSGAVFHRYRFEGAEFDESTGQLWVGGTTVSVEPLPLQLLSALLRRADEVLTKEELFEVLWSGRPTVDNVLANAVSKLRRALGDDSARRIVTVPRVGYRLAGPVDRQSAGTAVPHLMLLESGHSVTGRAGYLLERCLDHAGRRDVWLARHGKTGDVKVFKFAQDSLILTALKREFANHRRLRERLGSGIALARVVDVNLLVPPFHIESEHGGSDLLRWSNEHRQLTDLPLTDRIAMFMKVARAVSAAHEVGVLHGNLQPSKVLVTGSSGAAAISLIGFGGGALQAWHEQALAPGEADLLPPPAAHHGPYAAPELIAGKVSTQRGDVFALGVLLYQLLVADLHRPMADGWQSELSDPWLLADVSAAVAPDPAERLSSVAELIQRLSQLEARRAQRWQQQAEAEKCLAAQMQVLRAQQRRPWFIALLASLVVGLAASLWFGAAPAWLNALGHTSNPHLRTAP